MGQDFNLYLSSAKWKRVNTKFKKIKKFFKTLNSDPLQTPFTTTQLVTREDS